MGQVERIGGVDLGERPGRLIDGSIVLRQPLERFPGEIQSVERRLASLQQSHDAEGLFIMIEAAELRHAMRERILAGMAERRVAKIVRQRDSDLLRGRRRPGSCASAGGTPSRG